MSEIRPFENTLYICKSKMTNIRETREIIKRDIILTVWRRQKS